MSIESALQERSGSSCELCGAKEALQVYAVPPQRAETADNSLLVCGTCLAQIEDPEKMDANHWRCLNDSMWTPVPAVQAIAWRMLDRLRGEGWPLELLDMLYLDEDTLSWAQDGAEAEAAIVHKDCNGEILQTGDTVILTKSLDVKGTSLTGKRGTAVRNIYLVPDNPEHIEGKVDGQRIVILTKFVKKSN